MIRFGFVFLLLTTFLFGVISPSGDDKEQQKPKTTALDLKNLDTTISPADDFFSYACGGWVKRNPIPDEFARWGSFEILAEQTNGILKDILESLLNKNNLKPGSPEQKMRDFYKSGMDSAKIEADGYKPITHQLELINNIKDKKDFFSIVAAMHLAGENPLFYFAVTIDSKNSDVMAAKLNQGGLGLPDVEYYTGSDNRSKEIREKYVAHITNMFKLINADEKSAKDIAERVMKVEMGLAKVSNTRVENRDPDKTYNKLTLEELQQLSPALDWKSYLTSLEIAIPEYLIVGQPKFFKELSILVENTTLEDLKDYLKWDILSSAAPSLSSIFVQESFDFNSKYLTGTKVIRPRWKRVLGELNRTTGELLGQLYVQQVFPPEVKNRALKIVNNLLTSMGESISGLDWMGEKTKKAAMDKLAKFTVKIGYPDKWKDYTTLQLTDDSFYRNIQRCNNWSKKKNLEKLGKPVDRTEWGISPQTVNAYYSPNRNEIVFPAAILQPPFYNPDADDAINYGAMGAVIGHEITHGFDDQGRKYDPSGNLRDWWTKEDQEKFKSLADMLIDQFNNYTAIDTFRVNGALTLGENIGDLGGLTISFAAFKKTEQYEKMNKIDGYTPSQRFFLSWGQVWATAFRPEALKLRLKTDVHSPGNIRAFAPLRNLHEFFEAFNVPEGSKMRISSDKIVKIW